MHIPYYLLLYMQIPAGAGFAVFFIVFIAFGSFFLLELLTGAIVNEYNQLNEESGGMAFQSDRQKRMVGRMVLKSKQDFFVARWEFQQNLHDFSVGSVFVNFIIACIALNIAVMAMVQANMSPEYTQLLDFFNHIFTSVSGVAL